MTMRPDVAQRFEKSIEEARRRAEALRANIKIPPPTDPVDWIEQNVCIPSTVSTVGGMLIDLYGFQKGLIRLALHSKTKWFVVPKGTRTGVTQLFTAINAFHVFYEGKPVGLWQPTDEKAEKYDKEYWHATVRESPKLAKFIRKPKRGEPLDTWFYRTYTNGGKFLLSSATVDDNFRGDTVVKTSGDEVDADGWRGGKKGTQGKKFGLMWERSRTFWDRAQYIWSSPLEEETSNIWREWLLSDQRHYNVRCPHCGEVQYLKWGGAKTDFGIKWSLDENGYVDKAWYVCEHNGCVIEEAEKYAMDEEAGAVLYNDDDVDLETAGKRLGWQPTRKAIRPGWVGCHVPGYISLFAGAAWKQLAQEWLDAQGDPEALQTFVNNLLGEPWRRIEVDQVIEIGSYATRRPVPYEDEVPAWVKYLFAYVDVQDGWLDPALKLPPRLEMTVLGAAAGYEAAVIGHFVLKDGDLLGPQMLAQLDDIAFRKWRRAGDGAQLQIVIVGLDGSSGEHLPILQTVARAPHRLHAFRVFKGENETAKDKAPIIINAPMPNESMNKLYRIGTRRAKDLANRMVRNDTPGPFHLWFPKTIQIALDDSDGRFKYFDGVFAERRVLDGGVEKWARKAKMNTGEPWDGIVGCIAALELGMLTYPEISREIGDMRVQPPRLGYDGPDRSVMADILSRRMVSGFDGTTSRSLIPSLGTVNLPDRVRAPSPVADTPPEEAPAAGERRSGLKVRAYVGVPDTPRPDQPAQQAGMRIKKGGLTVRKRTLV